MLGHHITSHWADAVFLQLPRATIADSSGPMVRDAIERRSWSFDVSLLGRISFPLLSTYFVHAYAQVSAVSSGG